MTVAQQALSIREKIRLFRGHAQSLAPLPVACAALIAGVWFVILQTIQHEKTAITERALSSVAAQAQTYADQLERNVAQLDYILLSLKFHWQKNGGALNLEEQVDAGLVPKAAKISVTVVDRTGAPVTTTIPGVHRQQNVAPIEYFQFHSTNPSKDLHISRPVRSILTGRDVVFLSRRLDDKEGAFSGVIVIAIEPLFLGSFVDETQLRKDDFVAIRRSDGAFFASKTGDSLRSPGPLFKGNPFTGGPNGARAVPAEDYADGKARIVAWKTTTTYPIVSVVGVSEAGLLKGYQSRNHELLLIGATSSLLLFIVCIGGIRRAALRILKTHHVSQVHASYRIATENAKEGFFIFRPLYDKNNEIADFIIEDCNERGAMYRGSSRDSLIGKTLSSLSPALHNNDMLQACRQAMETGFLEDELQEPQPGSRTVQWLQRRLVRSSVGLAMTLRDITEIKLHQEALVDIANADALTSLPNRHWLMDYLPTAIDKARSDGIKLAIMFVDLDDFKNINDTLGHPIGDELLKAAALRLKAVIRPEDKVARLGGDEFTVIAHAVDTRDEAALVAERVIDAFRSPFVLGEEKRHYSVYATVGISMFPEDGEDGQTLIKKADIAMYEAKGSTKGTYCFFESSQEHRLVTWINRQAELKLAIERRELTLHYQPRVSGDTGEITSMEALVRWNHPVQGCMPPNEFIPLAEKTGLIVSLGTEVARMACAQLAQWKNQGLRVVPISINVAPQQINAGTSSAMLVNILQAYGLEPGMIEVEVTESATVTEEGDAVAELATIQEAGMKLYVDDFGTGYSCLAQLKRLHMDGLKIDRAFTAQLLNGPADGALFEAIVSMAHALGMRVVAEGVETAEQLAALQSLGCEEIQGYFISRPVPASEAALMLEKRYLFPAVHQD